MAFSMAFFRGIFGINTPYGDDFSIKTISPSVPNPRNPTVLRLLPNGSLLEPGGPLPHLGIRRATELSPREGTEQVVQLGLEMLQDQPGELWKWMEIGWKLIEIDGKWMENE